MTAAPCTPLLLLSFSTAGAVGGSSDRCYFGQCRHRYQDTSGGSGYGSTSPTLTWWVEGVGATGSVTGQWSVVMLPSQMADQLSNEPLSCLPGAMVQLLLLGQYFGGRLLDLTIIYAGCGTSYSSCSHCNHQRLGFRYGGCGYMHRQ
jgi:hypothetical protein